MSINPIQSNAQSQQAQQPAAASALRVAVATLSQPQAAAFQAPSHFGFQPVNHGDYSLGVNLDSDDEQLPQAGAGGPRVQQAASSHSHFFYSGAFDPPASDSEEEHGSRVSFASMNLQPSQGLAAPRLLARAAAAPASLAEVLPRPLAPLISLKDMKPRSLKPIKEEDTERLLALLHEKLQRGL